MKRTITVLVSLLLCTLLLAGCGCDHSWMAATCEEPKTCELCGETEGEAKGHSWVDATCTEAKHCENCRETKGEALGHTWEEATTEAPKTCTTCGETEGERIITDPRFTTAAAKPLMGKWTGVCTFSAEDMGIPDFDATMEIVMIMEFGNAGDYAVTAEVSNEEAFKAAMIDYTIELTYQEMAAAGLSREEADELLKAELGYDIPTYVKTELESFDVGDLFTASMDTSALSGFYYVEDGKLYTGFSWDDMAEEAYTLENDTLVLDSLNEGLGMDVTFTRAN